MLSSRNATGFFGVNKRRLTNQFQAKFGYNNVYYKKYFYSAEEAAQWIDDKIDELGIREIMEARRDSYDNKKDAKKDTKEHNKKEKEYKHGHPGIRYCEYANKWIAYIVRGGKKIKRKRSSKEAAIQAYEELIALYPPKGPKPKPPKKERKPLKTKEENKARQRQYNKERYKKNAEEERRKSRERMAKRKLENPEYYKELHRKHYEANKDLYTARAAARRAKTKKPPIWCPEANKVYARMRREAKKLEELTAIVFEVDHIVPLNAGTTPLYGCTPLASGLHCTDNFQLLTQLDNSRKLSYTWPDMWDYDDSDLLELQRIYEERIKPSDGPNLLENPGRDERNINETS